MNKIQTIINCVLGAAVVALFVIVFAVKPGCCSKKHAVTEAVVAEGNMPIAYLNTDSLLANYIFAQEAQEQLMSKQEDARLKLNTRGRSLQNEMAEFQRKLDAGAFLSQERAQSEYARLGKKQQELEQLEQNLTAEILEQQQQLNMQLADSLNTFLAEFNADHRFQIIMANNMSDNILMAADGYDITNAIIEGMNARLAK